MYKILISMNLCEKGTLQNANHTSKFGGVILCEAARDDIAPAH